MSTVVVVADAAVPSGRAVRRYVAAAGSRRTGASLVELLNDVWYVLTVAATGVLLGIGAAGQLGLGVASGPTTSGDLTLATVLAVVGLAATGLLLSTAARLGPVGLGPAEAGWLLGLPVDRRGLLRPVARRWPAVAALPVAAVAVVADAGLVAERHATALVATALTAGLAAAAVVLAAGVAQSAQAPRGRLARVGDLLTALTPVAGAVAVWVGWAPSLPRPGLPAVVVATVVVVVLALVLDVRLGRVRARSLREAGSFASQAGVAVVSLDSRALGRVLTEGTMPASRRSSRRLAVVHGPVSAVVAADLLLLARSPRHLVQLVVALTLPVLVVGLPELAGRAGVLVALAVGGALAAGAGAEGARRVQEVPALDRLLPLSASRVRLTRLAVPALTALVWALPAFAVAGWWAGDVVAWCLLGVVASPVWAAAVLRSAYRPAPDWGGALVATPMGALPYGVLNVVSRGPDVAVLGLVPVLVAVLAGVGPAVVAGQAVAAAVAVAVAVARGGRS